MVRKFDAVTFRWALSRPRLAWLVVSEGYVYHTVKKLALFKEITINILITIIIITMMSCRSHHSDVDPLWLTFHLLKPARKICKKLCSPSDCLPTLCFLFTAELRSLSHSDAGWEELVSDVSSVKEAGVKTPQFHVWDTIPRIVSVVHEEEGVKTPPFHVGDTLPCIVSVVHKEAGVKTPPFHVGDTIPYIVSVADEEAGVKTPQFHVEDTIPYHALFE